MGKTTKNQMTSVKEEERERRRGEGGKEREKRERVSEQISKDEKEAKGISRHETKEDIRTVKGSAEDEVRKLSDELTGDKRKPVVHSTLLLPSLEEHPRVEESRLDLVEKSGGDEHSLEDGEEPVLERGD